jgi:hypothetical protein
MIANRFESVGLIAAFLAMLGTVGCGSREEFGLPEGSVARTGGSLSFDEWKETVRLRPGRDVFAVGDRVTPLGLVGDDEAFGYYLRHITDPGALTIHNGQTDAGTPVNVSAFPLTANLDYCIDRTALEQVVVDYGLPSGTDLYGYIDQAFGAAAAVWNEVLDIKIQHDSSRSRSCTPRAGDTITWYVRPMALQSPLEYLTFVLHPNHNRANFENREFLILDYLIQLPFPGALVLDDTKWEEMFSMDELLLRAIGNGLGFIDEANRGGVPGDNGTALWRADCRDDAVGGVFLTDANAYSVMTHPVAMQDIMAKPHCSGYRPKGYALSYLDVMGASCQYRKNNILSRGCPVRTVSEGRSAGRSSVATSGRFLELS